MKYAVLLSSALLIGIGLLTRPMLPGGPQWNCPDCDHVIYYQMSMGYQGQAPYMWRPLAPILDRFLGAQFVTLAALLLSALLTYAILNQLFGYSLALLGVVFFCSTSYFVRTAMADPYLTDSLAMVFILIALYAALKRNGPLFLGALIIGVLAKESVLLASVFWWTFCKNRRTLFQLIVLTAPAFVLYALLRIVMPSGGYSLLSLPPQIVAIRVSRPTPLYEYVPFGILPVLTLLDNKRWVVRLAPFLLLVYAQLLFASDTGRLLVLALPVMLIAGISGLRRLRPPLAWTLASAWFLISFVFFL